MASTTRFRCRMALASRSNSPSGPSARTFRFTSRRSDRARVGKDLEGFDVVPSVPLVVGADPRSCADHGRGYAALYLGGMGSREQNFYNALAVRMGFGEAAAAVQE